MTQPTPELTDEHKAACVRAYQVHEAMEVAQEMHKRVMAEMREELAALEDECARLEREIGLVTNELIERTAMAMHDAAGTGVPWKDLGHRGQCFVAKLARAVVLEMRHLTDAMRAAGTAAMQPYATPEEVFVAMIDAGLDR